MNDFIWNLQWTDFDVKLKVVIYVITIQMLNGKTWCLNVLMLGFLMVTIRTTGPLFYKKWEISSVHLNGSGSKIAKTIAFLINFPIWINDITIKKQFSRVSKSNVAVNCIFLHHQSVGNRLVIILHWNLELGEL